MITLDVNSGNIWTILIGQYNLSTRERESFSSVYDKRKEIEKVSINQDTLQEERIKVKHQQPFANVVSAQYLPGHTGQFISVFAEDRKVYTFDATEEDILWNANWWTKNANGVELYKLYNQRTVNSYAEINVPFNLDQIPWEWSTPDDPGFLYTKQYGENYVNRDMVDYVRFPRPMDYENWLKNPTKSENNSSPTDVGGEGGVKRPLDETITDNSQNEK